MSMEPADILALKPASEGAVRDADQPPPSAALEGSSCAAASLLHLLASASEQHASMTLENPAKEQPAHEAKSDSEHEEVRKRSRSSTSVRPQRAAAQRAAEARRVFIENKETFPDVLDVPVPSRSTPHLSRTPVERAPETSVLRALPAWVPKSLPFMATSLRSPNLKRAMWFFLDRLIREDANEFFFEPVKEEEVPGYSKLIKYAMDFSTMRKKLGANQYGTIQSFWDDYLVIFRNCLSINKPASAFFVEAERQLRFGADICQLVQDRINNLRKLYVRCARDKSIPAEVQGLVFSRFVEGAHTVAWKNRRVSNGEAAAVFENVDEPPVLTRKVPQASKVHRGDCVRCSVCELIRKHLLVWASANVKFIREKLDLNAAVTKKLHNIASISECAWSEQDIFSVLIHLRFVPPPCSCSENRPCCIRPTFWRLKEDRERTEPCLASLSIAGPISSVVLSSAGDVNDSNESSVITDKKRASTVQTKRRLADPLPIFDVSFAVFSSVLTKFNERFMSVDTAYLVNRMLERLGDSIFREDSFQVLQRSAIGRRKNQLCPPHVDWEHIKSRLSKSSYSLPSFWADFTVLVRTTLLSCKLLPDLEINNLLTAEAKNRAMGSSPVRSKSGDKKDRLQSSTAYLYLPRSSHGKGFIAGDSEFFNRTSEFLASNPTKSQTISFVKRATHDELMTLWQKQLWDISALIMGNDKARTRRLAKDKCIPVIFTGLKRLEAGEQILESDDEPKAESSKSSASSPAAGSQKSKSRAQLSKLAVAKMRVLSGKPARRAESSSKDKSAEPSRKTAEKTPSWKTAEKTPSCWQVIVPSDVDPIRADSIFRGSEASQLYGFAMERVWTAICLLNAHLSSPPEVRQGTADESGHERVDGTIKPDHEEAVPEAHQECSKAPLVPVPVKQEAVPPAELLSDPASPESGDVFIIPDDTQSNDAGDSVGQKDESAEEGPALSPSTSAVNDSSCLNASSSVAFQDSHSDCKMADSDVEMKQEDNKAEGTPIQPSTSDASDRELPADAAMLSSDKRKRRKRNEIQQLREAASAAGSSSNLRFDIIPSRRSLRKLDQSSEATQKSEAMSSPALQACEDGSESSTAQTLDDHTVKIAAQPSEPSSVSNVQTSDKVPPDASEPPSEQPKLRQQKRTRPSKTDESSGVDEVLPRRSRSSLSAPTRRRRNHFVPIRLCESDLPPPPALPPPLPLPIDLPGSPHPPPTSCSKRTPSSEKAAGHLASAMSPIRKTPRVLRNRDGSSTDGAAENRELNDIAPGIKSVVCGPLADEGCARAAPYLRRPFTLLDSFSRHLDCMITQCQPTKYRLHSALQPEPVKTSKPLTKLEGAEQLALERQYDDMRIAMQCLRLGKSSAHAVGVFAPHRYPAGSLVFEYIGEVIQPPVADLREPKYRKERLGDYFFRISDSEIIDATKKASKARFVNHSCDPNCTMTIITIRNKSKIVCIAARDIEEGQEITYDYKFEREEVKVPCFCGTARCRGTLN